MKKMSNLGFNKPSFIVLKSAENVEQGGGTCRYPCFILYNTIIFSHTNIIQPKK